MITIPYDVVIKKVMEKTSLPKEEIEQRINKKMEQLAGLISKEGAAHIIANELGVKLLKTEGAVKLNEVFAGMKDVETQGKVIRKFDKHEFPKGETTGTVASFIIADETDQIRVTLWNEQTKDFNNIKEGDIIKIIGVRARLNNNQRELHLDGNARLVINPANVVIGDVKTTLGIRKKINELTENDQNVELLATIVQVFDIRFFEVCSLCNKRLIQREEGFYCPEHGIGNMDYSYVLNVFLDDGTGTIRAVFFRNQARNLLKMEHSNIQTYRMNAEAFENVKNELLGEMIKIVGRVTKNTMFDRIEFMVNMVHRDIDPEEEIRQLTKNLETKSENTDEFIQ